MYKLTERAADDFAGIYDYTSEVQADHYTDALEAFFETLAGMPDMGRGYHAVPNVMRVEFQRHAIFFTVRDTDILIARVLHQQMTHKRHFL